MSLLYNNSVKTFPRQRIIIGYVVFYVVRVVLKDALQNNKPEMSKEDFKENEKLVTGPDGGLTPGQTG
jgi:hypothetical protein